MFTSLDYLKQLAPKIAQYQKPFLLSNEGVSEECKKDSMKFLAALKRADLWALKSKKIISIFLKKDLN